MDVCLFSILDSKLCEGPCLFGRSGFVVRITQEYSDMPVVNLVNICMSHANIHVG